MFTFKITVGEWIYFSYTGAATILAYLNEKNRPYSAQDVFSNLQKQHGLGKTVRKTLTGYRITVITSESRTVKD